MIKTVSEEVFKNTIGISYSRLSKLAESPQAYKLGLAEEPDSSAISLGSAVDIMLTNPERFDEKIYVMTADKPSSEMMLKFVTTYVSTGDTVKAHHESGFKIGIDAVLKKFESEGKDFANALSKAGDRKILDAEEFFKANQIVNTLKNNPFTKKYFILEDGIELLFQPNIIWDAMYNSLVTGKVEYQTAKSVLDIIRIDHKNKKIQPVELKTGAESFMKSYWKYKRYLQGAMYDTAIQQTLENTDSEYDVENIRFIYADSNLLYPPVIYQMTDDDILTGKYGREYRVFAGNNKSIITNIDNYWKIKGYTQLAAELEWHEKNNQWDYSYDIYRRNGEVDIDAFLFKF